MKNSTLLGDEKTKPIEANMPAFGRKSDNSGCVAGRLLPRVGRETDKMEAERQIPARFTECDLKKQSQF